MSREEDCVKYFIFFKEFENLNGCEEVNTNLESKVLEIKAYLTNYVQEYIWHKDAFNLIPKFSTTSMLAHNEDEDYISYPHLYGNTCYGDNIQDEWFIVFLLMKLTELIDGLIVRIIDSDGEFLLIEAAEFLPQWASPENCEGRVYVYQGGVHILPVEDSNKKESKVNICSACKLIRKSPALTIASPVIQKAVQDRIKGYPEKISELMHKTTAYVPVGVASILMNRPDLIAPAVLSFCNRDSIDMKVCRSKQYFPPEDRVMFNVTFTKCLYAMISHHKCNPDPRSEWNLPNLNDPDYKVHALGMNLAYGFEILLAQEKNYTDTSVESRTPPQKRWKQYLKKIQDCGYFQDLLEGSDEYNLLLTKAKDYFTAHCANFDPVSSIGQEILAILRKADLNKESFEKDKYPLTPPDDEAWLEINPDEFERMLEDRYGKPHVSCGPESEVDISSQLKKFLNHFSDFEGAVSPNDNIPSTESENVREDANILRTIPEEDQLNEIDNRIMFDPDQFSSAVQDMLDFIVTEDNSDEESDSSSTSEYDEMYSDINQFQKNKTSTMDRSELKQYMDQMDRELALTTMGESFEKMSVGRDERGEEAAAVGSGDNFEQIDVDKNAVKHLVESYKGQGGGSGPAENLLGPMGVKFNSYVTSVKKNGT